MSPKKAAFGKYTKEGLRRQTGRTRFIKHNDGIPGSKLSVAGRWKHRYSNENKPHIAQFFVTPSMRSRGNIKNENRFRTKKGKVIFCYEKLKSFIKQTKT